MLSISSYRFKSLLHNSKLKLTITRIFKSWLICLVLFPLLSQVSLSNQCTDCHQEEQRFSKFHSPYVLSCKMCHGGNPEGDSLETAHLNMEPYPGNLQTVEKSCGQARCHADLIPLVKNSIMNTVDGMISVTRKVYLENKPLKLDFSLDQRLSKTGEVGVLPAICKPISPKQLALTKTRQMAQKR